MAGMIAIFDFDETIIECDSDNWVVDELGFTNLFDQLRPTMPWNSLMDKMMKELHSHGKSMGEIAEVLKRVPIHPRVVPAIKSAYARGCDLKIVSDANTFFIETILKHHGIRDYFSEIYTNPSYVNEDQRLVISPFHDFNNSSHNCPLCPPNLCKGLVIESIKTTLSTKKQIIYLGDGKGDYCPILKLREGDRAMPRKNFAAWNLISENPILVKARIHEWLNGEELERVLMSLVSIEENGLVQVDCKLETLPNSAFETLPKALVLGSL